MRPFRMPNENGSWAYVIITGRGRWWGLCRSGRDIHLDLGRWRVTRRNAWTPLFAETHKFGPIQWWTSAAWTRGDR